MSPKSNLDHPLSPESIIIVIDWYVFKSSCIIQRTYIPTAVVARIFLPYLTNFGGDFGGLNRKTQVNFAFYEKKLYLLHCPLIAISDDDDRQAVLAVGICEHARFVIFTF